MSTDETRPYAVVTVADVYGQQRELSGKVEAALARQEAHADRLDDHENRLRSLEAWRYALPISSISAVAAAVAAIIAALVG
ncbi:hypothetical protein J4H86_21105 [Spiractinospora alimapuensis]|uniref:hypothetical protein n=1 Tax=Spiractinospora alimapuensis TaxID=2820884 RepID=UPI001F1C8BB0|nr:hypothetical protein [Spiractinospora alimapuensis]QVQ51293.1 hypothetical protein J4H86_21105 [Spiractinospora alimapuensis]